MPSVGARRCCGSGWSVALAAHEAGEHLRSLGTLFAPVAVRPGCGGAAARHDRGAGGRGGAARGTRRAGLRRVRGDVAGRARSRASGRPVAGGGRGRPARRMGGRRRRPRLVRGSTCQASSTPAARRFRSRCAPVPTSPAPRRSEVSGALRALLAEQYLPAVRDEPDTVGRERYLVAARRWTGSDIDPIEAYDWGWQELAGIHASMVEVAEQVLPGSSPEQAMAHLDGRGRGRRGRRGGPAPAAADDGHGRDRPARESLRHRRADPGGRGPDRAARARPPPPTTPVRAWTWSDPGGPGCRRSGVSASRCGTWSRPGTTRASPATTCSSRSGPTCPVSSRCSRPASGRCRRPRRAGRCTRSG